MKKAIRILLAILLVSVVALTVTACSENQDPCAKGHSWDNGQITKPATCAETGTAVYRCKVCGQTEERTLPVTQDHVWDEGKVTTEPTCTQKGVKTYTCTVCKTATRPEDIEATGQHAKGTHVTQVDPTCHSEGTKEYWLCKDNCGTKLNEEGYIVQDSDLVIAPLAHNYDNGVVTTEATCQHDGVKTFTCQNDGCSESYTQKLPKLAHNYDNGVVTTEATCQQEGVKTFTCQNDGCSESFTQTLPKLAHSFGRLVERVEPNCEQAGHKAYYQCAQCKQFFDEDKQPVDEDALVLNALGHTPQQVEGKAPDCTNSGFETYYKCTRCNKLFADMECEKQIDKPVVLPAKGHNNRQKIEPIPADCTHGGKTEGWRCADCGATLIEPKNTAPLGHSFIYTSDKDGVHHTVTCARCDYNKTEECTPAQAWQFDGDYHWHKCTVCSGDLTHEPHALQAGSKQCTECGKEVSEIIVQVEGATDHQVANLAEALNYIKQNYPTTPATIVLTDDRSATADVTFDGNIDVTLNMSGFGINMGSYRLVVEGNANVTLTNGTLDGKVQFNGGKLVLDGVSGNYQIALKADLHCNDADVTVNGAQLDHTWNNGQVTTPPTCEGTGTRTFTCTRCQATRTEDEPAKGHTYGTLIPKQEPTCTATGTDAHYQCADCHKLFVDENGVKKEVQANELVLDKLAHTYKFDNWTWDEKTFKTATAHFSCNVCGHTEQVEVKLIEQDRTPSTCVEQGKVEYRLEKDAIVGGVTAPSQTFTQTLPLAEHVFGEKHPAVQATCSNKGNKEYYQCSECKQYFVEKDGVKVPADWSDIETQIDETNHKYKEEWSFDGTNHWYECEYNPEHKTGVTGHEWQYEKSTDKDGSHIKTCKYCDVKAKEEECTPNGGDDKHDDTHGLKDGFYADADHHWQVCQFCEKQFGYEKHSFDKDTNDGSCTTCGHKFFEVSIVDDKNNTYFAPTIAEAFDLISKHGDISKTYTITLTHDRSSTAESTIIVPADYNVTINLANHAVHFEGTLQVNGSLTVTGGTTFEVGTIVYNKDGALVLPQGNYTFKINDTTCDQANITVGETKGVEHKYEFVSNGNTQHHEECTVCGDSKSPVAHTRGEDISYTGDWQHTYTCPDCDETVTEDCVPELNVCECGHTFTIEEVVEYCNELSSGNEFPGTYRFSGVATRIEHTKNGDHTSWFITVNGEDGYTAEIQCFDTVDGAFNVSDIIVGATITVSGALQNFNGHLEFNKGKLDQLTFNDVQVDFSYDSDKFAYSIVSPAEVKEKYPIGTEIQFTIEELQAKWLVKQVTVNGDVVDPDKNGVYKFTIQGATTVQIEGYEWGTAQEEVISRYDFDGGDITQKPYDGESASTSDTFADSLGGDTLKFTTATYVYKNAIDKVGNTCLKLGSSKNTAELVFTVPANITKVIIYVGAYTSKNNDYDTAKLTINNKSYEVTQKASEGKYQAITIDTSEVKIITIKTTGSSDYRRCMIDAIEFYGIGTVECTHPEKWLTWSKGFDSSCATTGERGHYTCQRCDKYLDEDKQTVIEDIVIPTKEHSYVETWQWADDHSSATLTLTCTQCDSETEGHTKKITEGIEITSSVTQVQSCENDELTTFTAKVTVDEKEYSNVVENVKTKDKLGHEMTIYKHEEGDADGKHTVHCTRCDHTEKGDCTPTVQYNFTQHWNHCTLCENDYGHTEHIFDQEDRTKCKCGASIQNVSVTIDGKETFYVSLTEAFAKIDEGTTATVKLLSDSTETTLALPNKGTVTLDLGEKTLTVNGGDVIVSGGTLTVTNGKLNAKVKVTTTTATLALDAYVTGYTLKLEGDGVTCETALVTVNGEHIQHNDSIVNDRDAGHHELCAICGRQTETVGHTLKYSNKTATTHDVACSVEGCDYTKTEVGHDWSNWSELDESRHHRTCNDCEYEETDNHSWSATATDNGEGQHKLTCTQEGCDAEKTEGHTLQYRKLVVDGNEITKDMADHQHEVYCSKCDYSDKEDHDFGTGGRDQRHDCDKCHEELCELATTTVKFSDTDMTNTDNTEPSISTASKDESGKETGVEVTFDFNKNGYGSAPAKYSDGIRVYQNCTIVISVPNGYTIETITITFGTQQTFTADPGTYNTDSHIWKGSSQKVTFTNSSSSTAKIKSFVIVVRGGLGDSSKHLVDTWTVVKGHEPTCTEEGLEEGICFRCGEKITRTASPVGHNWEKWLPATEANCTNPAYVGQWQCTNEGCGGYAEGTEENKPSNNADVEKERIVDTTQHEGKPLGHDLVWTGDKTDHWQECQRVGCEDATNHTQFSKGNHTLSYVEIEGDGTYHKVTCKDNCGYSFENEEHDTNGTGGSCSKCGYGLKVFTVGDTSTDSIDEAFEAVADNGGTITLNKDYNGVGADLMGFAYNDIVIDANSHTLTLTTALSIEATGTVKLEGTIIATEGITITDGKVVLNGATVTGDITLSVGSSSVEFKDSGSTISGTVTISVSQQNVENLTATFEKEQAQYTLKLDGVKCDELGARVQFGKDKKPISHTYSYQNAEEGYHAVICQQCVYNDLEKHQLKYKDITDDKHTEYCENCEYEATIYHDFTSGNCACGKVKRQERELTIDFTTKFSTYASGWNNSYLDHTLTPANLGVSGIEFSLTINASKQGSTINNMPVTKTKAITLEVTDGGYLTEFDITFKQWTTKSLGTISITITFSSGQETTIPGNTQFSQKFDLSRYTKVTKVVVSSTNENQAGIQSIYIKVN